MTRVALLAVLIPSLALADPQQDRLISITAFGGMGALALTYGVVETIFMLSQLTEHGYSEPKHTVPAGGLAAVSVIASVAALSVWVERRDEVGIVGGATMALSSLAMCFFVALAVHGWSIRQPQGY